MTARSAKGFRLEAEIEKFREESNWKKVSELADQLKLKHSSLVPLCNFLMGEAKLEMFIEEYPLMEVNTSAAKLGLNEAKKCLLIATGEHGVKAQVALDAHLLLGKLHYACGQYEDSLQHFMEADLSSLISKPLPSGKLRVLRMAAESFAIKGFSLEKSPPPSSATKEIRTEWEEQIVTSFESSGDLTLRYLQELDKSRIRNANTKTGHQVPVVQAQPIDPMLEVALLRAPLLHLIAGRLSTAVSRYRSVLSTVESSGIHSLKLAMSLQLAEVLLRGYTGDKYVPLNIPLRKPLNPWKPKVYSGLNLFVPKNVWEEIILLLLISDELAGNEAVLSQSPEFEEERIRALTNSTAVHDLLTIVLVRCGQISLLEKTIEKAMKSSYEEPHIWYQRALCLESMGHHDLALSVVTEVIRMLPTDVSSCLFAARICYLHLNKMIEGLVFSNMALQRETKEPEGLLSRCHLYIGIGSHYASLFSKTVSEKQSYNDSAVDSFAKAKEDDPYDPLIEFYMAMNFACKGQVHQAMAHTKDALELDPEHEPSLHLMVLLLTALKQYDDAKAWLDSSLDDHPESMDLLFLKASLELHMKGAEVALQTAVNMLVLWKSIYEEPTNSEVLTVDCMSEISDDSSSTLPQSIAASRVEGIMSDIVSSVSMSPKPPHRAWMIQVKIWLLFAELYLSLDQIPSAEACIHEASKINPLSHLIMYTKGLVHQRKDELLEAKQCFHNAASINPSHIKSLQHLGLMYHYMDNQGMAIKNLRDAALLDPLSSKTWFYLGKVFESQGDKLRASDCVTIALQAEKDCPILPYVSIQITFDNH